MQKVTVTNLTKRNTIGTCIGLADTSRSRLVGLLGKTGLNPGSGILITPSSGVHTFFMLFKIDVVALDQSMRVQRIWSNLAPFRITRFTLKTGAVLELAGGQIATLGIEPGDLLEIS